MPFVIRNILLRIVAVLEQIWNFIGERFRQFWGFTSKLLGLTETGYFLDADDPGNPSVAAKQSIEAKSLQTQANSSQSDTPPRLPVSSRSNARSKSSEMDYFRNMARQIKKS